MKLFAFFSLLLSFVLAVPGDDITTTHLPTTIKTETVKTTATMAPIKTTTTMAPPPKNTPSKCIEVICKSTHELWTLNCKNVPIESDKAACVKSIEDWFAFCVEGCKKEGD